MLCFTNESLSKKGISHNLSWMTSHYFFKAVSGNGCFSRSSSCLVKHLILYKKFFDIQGSLGTSIPSFVMSCCEADTFLQSNIFNRTLVYMITIFYILSPHLSYSENCKV